jgi:SAM-dependent MidA family methyltransferase
LNADEAEHVARTRAHIETQIGAAGGWISFERYMELALYAPGFGYYSAGAAKIGAGGDFTTAPEVSTLFGGCVARQCQQVLAALPGGSILEIGAGTGRLAVDVLRRLESTGRLPERYFVLEVSADLRDRQRQLLATELPGLAKRVVWLDAPPSIPFDGLIVANEVLDALPVARFVWRPDRIEELGVTAAPNGFELVPRLARPALAAACNELADEVGGDWPSGYASEISLRLGDWAREVTRTLRRGTVLWIDYGLPRAQYYLAERASGTLLCHFRQRAFEDPFRWPGLQDITAWVDFTGLAHAGEAAGYDIAGYTTQTYFLAGCGVDAEMRALAANDEQRYARLANEARRLMLPGEMGERFKVMAWTRGFDEELTGFAVRDFLHTL